MTTIWRFPFVVSDNVAIDMPKGAQVLTVQNKGDNDIGFIGLRTPDDIAIWALVDSDAEKETRRFRVFGTGAEFDLSWPINCLYIGTFQMQAGSLVFHLFELRG